MRILKRKKGEGEYYYLQHSFRKATKITTKEIYLGKEIPKDINKIKNEFKKKFQKELYKKLEKIKDNFQKEWKRLPKSAKEREKEEIAIAFTYNTNAIEGSTITLEEVREIIQKKISPNKSLRDVKETEFHSKVFLKMLEEKEKITKELLLRWHKEIFSETKQDIAGKFRDYPVRIESYIASDWQDIKELMKELVESINNKNNINPIELSAIIHYRFEKIHRFGDGNGRIGRLLMNHILWHSGYPMLIIEYKNRKSYYKALKGEEDNFIKYFIRRYLSVHNKRLKKN